MCIRTSELSKLRDAVKSEVSEKRYRHILGVEECAVRMAKCFPDMIDGENVLIIRAAALLHDVTKDKGSDWQKNFITEIGVEIPSGDENSHELWHSFTAPAYISLKYPDFSDERILSAVYKHATGDEVMSSVDKIICLADYIEDGRRYESCVSVRNEFFEFDFLSATAEERIRHLDKCLLRSLEFVKAHLDDNGERLSDKTKRAMQALQKEINSTEV